ncbi:hypothetical protein [Ammoniphilus sp. 3BR4]|uniref:hypothetical protein n=1 Tax=Ammoniphilus sp. 3BR4 TaxID=3158265 RepID=UPI003464F8D3
MSRLNWNEANRMKIINYHLDSHNTYIELYQKYGDLHFKAQAEQCISILKALLAKKMV